MKISQASYDDLEMTSLIGYMTTTYDQIVAAFGEPTEFSDKTTAEWLLKVDGVVFSIYDWKEPETPFGVYDWHIGGKDSSALTMLQKIISYKKMNAKVRQQSY